MRARSLPSVSRLVALASLAAIVVALDAVGCRTPTAMTVHVVTDVPCARQRGVVVAAASPQEYERLPPVGRSQQCVPMANGLFDMGTIVLVPPDDGDDRVGIRAVLGATRDVESCTFENGYAGCIVARRILRYLPHTELTIDLLLGQDCLDVPCDADTTCIRHGCVGADIASDSCRDVCGEGALGARVTSLIAMSSAGEKGSTCTLVEGAVYCWGDNTTKRLGLPVAQALVPTRVAGLPTIVQLAAVGTSAHVVALDVTGKVWCWGHDDSGECGPPRVADLAEPRIIADDAGAPIEGVVQVAASSNSSCLRTAAGPILCLGGNSVGQLGRGGTSTSDPLARAISTAGWSGKAIDLACATNACCLVDDTRKVVCWGNNQFGQLGTASTELSSGTPSVTTLPVPAHGIRAGDNAFCALTDDGGAWCWGDSGRDLFVTPMPNQNAPVKMTALAGKSVLDIAIGLPTGHYATTGNGTTYGWGTAGLVTGAVAPVPSLNKATRITLGWKHACAVVAGKVVCWGDDPDGALGDGTTSPHASPAPVKASF
jgi:hypothetical protein